MRRRALLTALTASAAATAGCSMLDDSERPRETFAAGETDEPTTTPMEFDPPSGNVERAFTVPGDDDHRVVLTTPTNIPDDVAITLGFASAPTGDEPARLYVRVQAVESADSAVEVPVGATPPLSTYRGVHEPVDGSPRPMFLVPRRAGADFDAIVRRDQACWRPRLPVGPEDATGGTRTLDPGEALSREYYLVTPWANDRCLQPGSYRFEADAGWSFHVCQFDVVAPGTSAFDDADVPALPGFADTRWYHDPRPELYLEPRSEQVGLPSATARFTFRNQTDGELLVDESAWALYKLVDDRWYPVAPLNANADDDRRPVRPGESSTLSLSLYTDPDAPSDDERTAVGGLREGRYAVGYPIVVEVPGRGYEVSQPTAALLTVVGNDPAFTPTDAVDHATDRDGVRHLYTTPDESAVATLRLERRENASAPGVTLITEQVLQRDALRDAILALRDAPSDVDAVVYHTEPAEIVRTKAWIDSDSTGLAFTYDGDAYEMTYG